MSAMSWAVRVSVPLNRRCSMKWEMPFCSGVSWREPRFIQTPTATERSVRIGSVIRTRPFPKVSLRMSLMTPMVALLLAGDLEVLAVLPGVHGGFVALGLPGLLVIGAAGDPELQLAGRGVTLLDLAAGVLEDRGIGTVLPAGDHLDDLEVSALPGDDVLVPAVGVDVLDRQVPEPVPLLRDVHQPVHPRRRALVEPQLRLRRRRDHDRGDAGPLRVERPREHQPVSPAQRLRQQRHDGVRGVAGTAGGEAPGEQEGGRRNRGAPADGWGTERGHHSTRIFPSRTARHKSMDETRPVTFPFLRIGTRWMRGLHMTWPRSVVRVSSSAEMAGLVMIVLTGISIGSGERCSAQNGLSPARGGSGGAARSCRPRRTSTTLREGRRRAVVVGSAADGSSTASPPAWPMAP